MTVGNRTLTPPDQQDKYLGPTYCCWPAPVDLTEWQISLGGLTMGKNTSWCITAIDGLGLPGTRTTDVPNTFLHGTSALGDFADGRTIRVDVAAKFATAEEAWEAIRTAAGVWQPNVWDQTLRIRVTGSRTLMLIGHPRRMQEDTKALYKGIAKLSLEFYADDPRFYDAAVTVHDIDVDPATDSTGYCFDTTPGPQFCIPATTGICIPRGTSGNRVVTNAGNARVAPIIWIVGNATNIRAENTRTGEWWEWEGTTGSGVFMMDHLFRRCVLDEVEVYQNLKVGSRFWWLDPGETRVNVRVDSGSCYASVRFRSGWF